MLIVHQAQIWLCFLAAMAKQKFEGGHGEDMICLRIQWP